MPDELDLSVLSMDELKSMATQIDRAIEASEKRSRADALAAAEAAAKQAGYTLDELLAKPRSPRMSGAHDSSTSSRRQSAAGPKPPPKYRDLSDESNVWSGRGRAPRWFTDAIGSGKSAEDMAIPSA